MNEKKIEELKISMINQYAGDPKRIHHFLKVHSFSKLIGEAEEVDPNTEFILESAALVHDIGIHLCEEKYNRCDGALQEKEGPALAKTLLESLEYEKEDIERICFLVGHHHTYADIEGMDYQILIEADFLVNIYEDNIDYNQIKYIRNSIFKTECGKALLQLIYQ